LRSRNQTTGEQRVKLTVWRGRHQIIGEVWLQRGRNQIIGELRVKPTVWRDRKKSSERLE
jgi:hypothetical protein